jgi:hypothetical protein
VQNFEGSVVTLIERANHSAAGLVNLLAEYFPCFRDEVRFEGRTVRFLKRAQIFVADLWAAFGGEGYGQFDDIDKITMFAGGSGPFTQAVLQEANKNQTIEFRRYCTQWAASYTAHRSSGTFEKR